MKPWGAVASQSHMSCSGYKTLLRPANRCLTVSAAFPFDVLFSNSIVIRLAVELNKVVECLYSSVVRADCCYLCDSDNRYSSSKMVNLENRK